MDHYDTNTTQNLDTGTPHSTPNHPSKDGPAGASLGTLAKSVKNRRDRFRLQRQASNILGRERVGKCLWSVADLASSVRVLKREDKARFQGLQTCGSVWHCPVCSHKVSETRRKEMNEALKSAEAQKIGILLLTFTFAHKDGQTLSELVDGLKETKKHWHNSGTYKKLKDGIHGSITATEVTHGANGWHPHLHMLFFIDPEQFNLFEDMDLLDEQWLTSLEKKGHSGKKGIAFQWQLGQAAGNYVSKWGAAEELSLSSKKEGKGFNPFQLLDKSQHDPRSRALFYEYALAFKGKRQLLWSQGLKELLGVSVATDEEAAVIEPDNQDEWLYSFTREEWRQARGDKTTDNRAAILESEE